MAIPIIDVLLASNEPSIRYKVKTQALGESDTCNEIQSLRQEIKYSPLVRALLSRRDSTGRIEPVDNPYRKWQGAHWVLTTLADIGYPTHDPELEPVCEQVTKCWLHRTYLKDRILEKMSNMYRHEGVPILNGRARRCASQQGNALYSTVILGFSNEGSDQLAELLMHWQWPDGGWNCDRKPDAHNSSFYETITPLRGLIAYAKQTRSKKAKLSAERASEVFLKRRLYKRQSDGSRMRSEFTNLHYPNYWHYDILHGLKVMVEGGFIGDQRCSDALDLLESMQLPEGGWPATAKHYDPPHPENHGSDLVSWGGVKRKEANEWITADALSVLVAAGRLSP